MSSTNSKKRYAQVTVRSQYKKIDDMSFECPLSWNLLQLKTFVYMHHKQSSEYIRPDKVSVFFAGKLWSEEEKVIALVNLVNISHILIF